LLEGYVANSVGHEGAVKVLDDDTADDGSLYLVTEHLDGETLEDRRLRFGGRLDEDEVLCIADQLLDVLTAAHAKGIVPRDLKPENVFLTRAGQVKVLDFGIARLREFSSSSSATETGSTMGTPAYMSPEPARGLCDEVDARSDLWKVGATLFTLLSGHVVHEGRTTNEHLPSAMTQAASPLVSVAPGVSPAVAHLVDRALAYDRGKRWSDAGRMQEAVRHAYHDRNGRPITTSPRLSVPVARKSPMTNSRLRAIGFWFNDSQENLPLPQLLVDHSMPKGERLLLARYLRGGSRSEGYRGYSWCRFHCGERHEKMGDSDLTDGVWLWPEGLAHYVQRHDVVLPAEFVAEARARDFNCPTWTRPSGDERPFYRADLVEMEFWTTWACRRDAAINLSPPWQYEPPGLDRDRLRSEMTRELSPKHPLAYELLVLIARRLDRDDVLLRFYDTPLRLAVAHLTWSGKEEPADFPRTKFFESWGEWNRWRKTDASL
jgi:serine/threonine-protein kinase